MSSFTTKYDEQLQTLVHYQNYPQMLPFIGADYDSQGKKLLIISESHYLPEDSVVDVSKWYEMDESTLSEDDAAYIHTRNVLLAHIDNQNLPFKPIADAIINSGFKPADTSNMFRYSAWCNFFQRPEKSTGDSIEANETDREKAEEVLGHLFETIEPTHVLFASSKAWAWSGILRHKCKDKGIIFDYAPHPNTAWWNREAEAYGDMKGHQKFEHFLKENNIFA